MNSVPSLASPTSPYSERQSGYFADRQEAAQQQSTTQAGLGLYPLSIPQTSHQSSVRTASPHHSSAWSQTSAEQQSYSATVSSHQDMYATSPFENFSTFASNAQHQPQHPLSSPEAPSLEYCQSTTSSDLPSHRSSVCSYTSEASEMNMATARPKADEHTGTWYSAPTSEHILQRPMTSPGQIHFPQGQAIMPSHTEELYRTHSQAASEWSATDSSRMPPYDMAPVLPSVHRVNKKKRQRTRPEEATHECQMCGKLFKRSYNWKSHMETHNPDRKYPHPCTAMVGNQQCTKKFQRKTDLDRHYESVHLKARNHKCLLCGNRFARRDTLRRHTEDGCPKRFEVGLRDAAAAQMHQHQQQQQQHHQHHQPSAAMSSQLHQTPSQNASRWSFTQATMAPPMMPPHLSAAGPAFSAYAMPPPAVPYQA